MSLKERTVFSLEGPEKQEQRRHIYRFMLENMMDEDRFKVTYRLCTDVLAGVAEEGIELTSSGTTLLQDALYVLSCEEIRLAQLRPNAKENDDDDGGGGEMAEVAQAINNLARKTLISQVVKKNMIENVVPIFIKLKHKLKQLKSPLVRDLMACLRELMKDYKTEINDILSADKELAAEIQHDLQNAEDEDDNADENRVIVNEEILKKTVMEVLALNEVRMSMNGSKRQSPRANKSMRLSTSSAASQPEKSPASVKSTRGSPAGSVSSQVAKVSPTSNKSSPGANKSPACSSSSSPLMQLPGGTPGTSKQTSPSNSSTKSDTPSVKLEPAGGPKKATRRKTRRSSASSITSEASAQSQSSSSSRRRR